MSDPPLVEMISEDPVLRNTKLISEAWDCDGLFQVSSFLSMATPCREHPFAGQGSLQPHCSVYAGMPCARRCDALEI